MPEGILAVAGTLLGAITGGLIALILERQRQRYQDRSRWHTERRQLYAQVLRAADAYAEAMRSHALRSAFLRELHADPTHLLWPERPDREPLERACREAELLAS